MNSKEDLNSGYLAYMLRMWRKKDGSGKPVWCASLQEPGSKNIDSFADMSALFAFLQGRTGVDTPSAHSVDERARIDSGQSLIGPPED